MPKRVPFLCVLSLVLMEAARSGAALGGDVEAIKGDLESHTSDTPTGALLLAQFGMLGGIQGFSRRQEGLLCAVQALHIGEQSAQSQSGLYAHFHEAGRQSYQ